MVKSVIDLFMGYLEERSSNIGRVVWGSQKQDLIVSGRKGVRSRNSFARKSGSERKYKKNHKMKLLRNILMCFYFFLITFLVIKNE
jgi:hypothetical protein